MATLWLIGDAAVSAGVGQYASDHGYTFVDSSQSNADFEDACNRQPLDRAMRASLRPLDADGIEVLLVVYFPGTGFDSERITTRAKFRIRNSLGILALMSIEDEAIREGYSHYTDLITVLNDTNLQTVVDALNGLMP